MTERSHQQRQHPTTSNGAVGRAGPLIDVSDLHTALESDNPPVILDVRWSLAGADRPAFAGRHIPGAIFVDLDTELTAPPGLGGRHPLPERPVLQNLLCRAGIHDTTPVVVCGERDASNAARAWWLLRWGGHSNVRVLDGGIEAWQQAGFPVATGEDGWPGGGTRWVAAGRMRMPTVDADGAASMGRDHGAVLLDARAPERYRGEVEPVDPVAGHIPGAVNLPLDAIHRPDGRLREVAELRQLFESVGIHDDVPVAASCGSGVNACALILAGAMAGYRFSLYPGSYSGWCALGREVQTGPGPGREVRTG